MKINKLLTKALMITLTIISIISLSLLNSKIAAASSKFYYINCSVGETYDTVGINYHSDLADSYISYSTNSSMANPIRVDVNETEWLIPTSDTDEQTGFTKRYVCQANLTNLSKATTYYYQVISGSEKSEVYSFLSATDDFDEKKSFMVLADIHAYTDTISQKTQAMISKVLLAERQNKVKMILTAGDNVDRGGYETTWNALFNNTTSFKDMLWATIPGNHEYYHDNGSGYISPYYYNQFFNNPDNGPAERLNSTYYFKYGNALFIMLDTVNREYLTEQKGWFKEVVKNNPSSWIIVVSHPGCYSGGSYADDAKWMYNNWHTTFEECQVDLALSGHEHVYARKDTVFNNELNETLGVTYQILPAAGMKSYAITGTKRDLFDEVHNINYSANVITLSSNELIFKTYSETGILEASYTLLAKRPYSVETISDDEILDAITSSYDKENNRLTVNWGENLWGNVKSIASTCENCVAGNWEKVIVSTNLLSYDFGTVWSSYDYYFNLAITKIDGTVLTKQIEVINIEPTPIVINMNNKMLLGKEYSLEANQKVSWSTSDDTILKIVDGKAVPVATGRVNLIASIGSRSESLRVNVVMPEAITFNINNYMTVDKEYPLEANQDVTWTSSDETILKIVDGKALPLKAGNVTLSITNGISTETTTVEVFKQIEVTIANKMITGKEYTLMANQEVSWTSSDVNFKIINGKVTPEKAGNFTITVSNGAETKEINTTVVPGISVTVETNMTVGSEYTLNANQNVTWTSSDESILKIIDGKAIPQKAGTVTITAANEDDLNTLEITIIEAAKKGCKKKAGLIIFSLISISMTFIILRKKK